MKVLIRRCHELNLIDQDKMKKCLDYISSEYVHVELRNLIMMILLPKKLHVDDSSQAAFVRAAVSRVSFFLKVIFNFCHLQIANPTVMEPRGLDFLRPIWYMMQRRQC